MPTPPKITGTTPTRSHAGLGLSTPRTASVALAAKVTIAAVQSSALACAPSRGRLRKSARYPENAE